MDNYNGYIEALKVAASFAAAFFVTCFGASYKHIIVLICFMAADTIIGWIVAKYMDQWRSDTARWGFVGKIIELMFVAMLYLLDWLFDMNTLKYIGIYYFIICEGASFVENISKINSNIPQGLTELLRAFQKSIGSEIVNKVKEMINK